jgi:hypothetical protein
MDNDMAESQDDEKHGVIEAIFPVKERLHVKNSLLCKKYIYDESLLSKRNMVEEDTCQNPIEKMSYHKKIINEITTKLKIITETQHKLNYLEYRGKREKKFLDNWDERFNSFEEQERKWVEKWNKKYSVEDLGNNEHSNLGEFFKDDFKELVKNHFCNPRYGEWTRAEVLADIQIMMKPLKRSLGIPVKKKQITDESNKKEETSQQKPDENISVKNILENEPEVPKEKEAPTELNPYIKVICENPEIAIEKLWVELNIKYIQKINFEEFNTHFFPDLKSEGKIIWKLKSKTLVYLFYHLIDIEMFYEPMNEVDLVDAVLDHFNVPSPKGGSRERKKQRRKLEKTLHDIKKAHESEEPRKRKSNELDHMDHIIYKIKHSI